jgi:glycerophosphoryl diester phosphodiesterase
VARACHQQGIGIMVWTVDAGPLIDHFLLDRRIDVLITNRPERATRRRAELGLAVPDSVGESAPSHV